jgi:hypothetical protein
MRGVLTKTTRRAAWEGNPEGFDLLDANGDGFVSRDEIEKGLGSHALRLAQRRARHHSTRRGIFP